MAKTQTKPEIAPVSYTTDERLLATRYKQGSRTVYSVALTPDQIVNLIQRPDPEGDNPGNRRIRTKHAQDFAKYYLSTPHWVIPGIILRAPNIFNFESDKEVGDGSAQFGIVSYPRRLSGDVQILDGQHRILGFHLALDEIAARIDKSRDYRNAALRSEGGNKHSPIVLQADKDLAEAQALQERFYNERVAVEIHVTDNERQFKQMFFDIADNALGITASVKSRFDSTKVVNRALPAVMEHPLLDKRVDIELDRLGRGSKYFLTARHVAEITRSRIVGLEGRVSKNMEKELSETGVAGETLAFFDSIVTAFPQLTALVNNQTTPEGVRQSSLVGSPLFLRVLAGVTHELISRHGFGQTDVTEFFTKLAPHSTAPVHANSIWIKHIPEDSFNIGSVAPSGRRQDYIEVFKAIWGWAIDKPAFLDEAPEPAPVIEDEPEPIDYSDLGSEELARRLHEEDVKLGIAK